jgi:hypothetical protein
MSKIEGIPDGWELVRIGRPECGEWVLLPTKTVTLSSGQACGEAYVILRKVEKLKTYRPFKNRAEFKPHRDRWCRIGDCDSRVQNVTDERVYFRDSKFTWEQAYIEITFDDGTPFGVEVQE